MRIGFYLMMGPGFGGLTQYARSLLFALRDNRFRDVVVILHKDFPLDLGDLGTQLGWQVVQPDPSLFVTTAAENATAQMQGLLVQNPGYNAKAKRYLESLGIGYMVYPHPNKVSFQIGIPYAMAVHDLQHRLQPEFAEVSFMGTWKVREFDFANGIRHAHAILVDSEVGKEDVLDCYPDMIDASQIHVLPFIPGISVPADLEDRKIRVKAKHNLPNDFFFYPAQFWAHKNHLRIVQSMLLLEQKHGIKVHLVLCGSKDGPEHEMRGFQFARTIELAEQFGIASRIRYLGFVPDGEMEALYALAKALVMPTFFGPTNIPYVEAWCFGCPVIASDIRGIREQVGAAGVLVDPNSSVSIMEAMYRVLTDTIGVEACRQAGYTQASQYGPRQFQERVHTIFAPVVDEKPSIDFNTLIENGQGKQAIDAILPLVRQDPQRFDLFLLLAKAYQAIGLVDTAEQLLAELRRQAPELPGLAEALQPKAPKPKHLFPSPPPITNQGNIPKYVPDGEFYSPIVETSFAKRQEASLWNPERKELVGIDFNRSSHERMLSEMPQLLQGWDYPEQKPMQWNGSSFYVDNDNFVGTDARILFAMLRRIKPQKLIEVGSGFSTLLTSDVNSRFFQNKINVSCIEPYRDNFSFQNLSGVSSCIKAIAQDVPVEYFLELGPGDILFIDSSHVSKTGSDVNHLVFEVLPRLRKGVYIHFHDIFLPNEYPKSWVLEKGMNWNEQYIVRALLLFSSAFEVVFGSAYASKNYGETMLAQGMPLGGGSLWIRKKI